MKIESLEHAQELIERDQLIGIFDCDNEIYHKIPAISKSNLDLMKKSPMHYDYFMNNPREQTPAMRLGSMIHAALLEPELFADEYVCVPKEVLSKSGSRAGTKYKEWKASLTEGQKEITPQEYNLVQGMIESLYSSNRARFLLDGPKEKAVFAKDPRTGILKKCKPDITHISLGAIADLKTTDDARPEKFIKKVVDFGYHRQSAWYIDTINQAISQGGKGNYKFVNPESFFFIVIEKEAPHAFSFFDLEPEFVQEGRDQNDILLDAIIAHKKREGKPVGFTENVVRLTSKSYMYTSRSGVIL